MWIGLHLVLQTMYIMSQSVASCCSPELVLCLQSDLLHVLREERVNYYQVWAGLGYEDARV